MLHGKFITLAEFAYLTPINVFHREEETPSYSHPEGLKNLHITFRGTFTSEKSADEKILLRFSADDYAKIYINGQYATQGPAQGYYFAYPYVEADISDLIKDGENEITADVYYQGLINRAFDSGDLRCGFIADIVTGDRLICMTDENWQCRIDRSYTGRRRTGYDTQYLEDRDMRIMPTEWERVRIKENADYTFHEQPFPALSVCPLEEVSYVSRKVSLTTDDRTQTYNSMLFDYGRETVGTVSLRIRAKDGDRVIIRAAEELAPLSDGSYPTEGELNETTEIRYQTRANCEYEETVLTAYGDNSIEQYDYKAFRYVEILYPLGNTLLSCHVNERHYPLDYNACVLKTSDKVLSDVFTICKNGVMLGSQEVYVDCPGREKGQYAGDLTITSASQVWLSGDIRLFVKAIDNQMESAFIDEGLMAVTPGSLMQEIADYSLQFPILALRYYSFTGDRDGLTKLLGVCDRLLTYFEQWQRDDGLLDGVTGKWNLVDWPKNLRDDYDFPMDKPIGKGVHNVMNAFYIGAVILTEKIIDILHIPLEASDRRSDALIAAYNKAFWRPSLGLYADSETSSHASLHSNVLPLYFGFAKKEAEPYILNLIRKRGFSSGVYMSYFTMKALAKLGCYGDIWNMLTSTGECSWYNMVREGATTCFEAWGKDKKWNTSLCHPWASAPISVLIEDILGISPKVAGYGELDIRPHIPETVKTLSMKIPLVTGKFLHFDWENGTYRYRITEE